MSRGYWWVQCDLRGVWDGGQRTRQGRAAGPGGGARRQRGPGRWGGVAGGLWGAGADVGESRGGVAMAGKGGRYCNYEQMRR